MKLKKRINVNNKEYKIVIREERNIDYHVIGYKVNVYIWKYFGFSKIYEAHFSYEHEDIHDFTVDGVIDFVLITKATFRMIEESEKIDQEQLNQKKIKEKKIKNKMKEFNKWDGEI